MPVKQTECINATLHVTVKKLACLRGAWGVIVAAIVALIKQAIGPGTMLIENISECRLVYTTHSRFNTQQQVSWVLVNLFNVRTTKA